MFSCDAGHLGIPCDSSVKFLLLSPLTVTFFCDLASWSFVDGRRCIGGTCALHHRCNFAYIIGKGGGGDISTMVIRNLNL